MLKGACETDVCHATVSEWLCPMESMSLKRTSQYNNNYSVTTLCFPYIENPCIINVGLISFLTNN